MSAFGMMIKDCIKKSGYTVYGLAKTTGIERTSIYRAFSGKVFLQQEALQKILECLQLQPAERKTLLQAYEMEVLGVEGYRQRELICNLIESLYVICQKNPSHFFVEKEIHFSLASAENSLIQGKFRVIQMVQALLELNCYQMERPEFYLFTCADKDFLTQILPSFHPKIERGEMKPVLHQLVHLYKTAEGAQYISKNLEILQTLLPFSLTNGLEYHIYYQYDNHDDASIFHNGLIFPYYVILKSCVIMLSADLQTACLQSAEEYVSYYRRQFEVAMGDSKELLTIYDDAYQLLRHHVSAQSLRERVSYLEYQPCFITFAKRKEVLENISPELPDKESILEMVMERIRGLSSSLYCSPFWIFTSKGLEYFMDTGILTDFPPGLSKRVQFEVRLELLKRMRDGCASESYTFRFLNTELFNFPPDVTIVAREFQGLEFFLYDEKNGSRSLIINELTLSKAFFNFISNMVSSSLVYTKEKTLELFDYYLDYYTKKGSADL